MRKIVCIIAAMAALAACNTAGPKLSRELRESAPAFAAGAQKRLVAMDLDATLTQHKTPLSDTNRIALDRLGEKYDLLMVGGGGAERQGKGEQGRSKRRYGPQASPSEKLAFHTASHHIQPLPTEGPRPAEPWSFLLK